LGRSSKYEAPHCAAFFILLLLHPSETEGVEKRVINRIFGPKRVLSNRRMEDVAQ
jgi:hypothetical protein